MRIFVLVLVVLGYVSYGDGARILTVFGMCARSHNMLGLRLVKELADRGHDVTFISAYPLKEEVKNLRVILVEETCNAVKDHIVNLYEMGRMSYLGQLDFASALGAAYTEVTLKNKKVQALLKSNKTFDLALVENFFNDAFAVFPHKFKCPLVWLAPGPTTIFSNHLMANPSPSAFVPNLLSGYGAKMNFWERLDNLILNIVGEAYLEWKIKPEQNTILQRTVLDAPLLKDILYKGNFMLITSHVSISDPVPLQQNIKEIGGYHVGPIKPIPEEIRGFLDNATEGAILFSMGSNLRSADFPEDKKRAILTAFSKIKQKVLWKFETDLPEKPDNVKIMSWLPQQDTLAHPNIVLFITHSGLLGTIESVYHGVPLLGLPVFWDQVKNIEDVARKNFGLKLNFEDITEESFERALNEILNNPKYLRNARTQSKIMRGQPMNQLDEAVFWIEYVIEHKGATFLRSPGADLQLYQRYLLDVAAFVAIALVSIIFIAKFTLRLMTTNTKASNARRSKKTN